MTFLISNITVDSKYLSQTLSYPYKPNIYLFSFQKIHQITMYVLSEKKTGLVVQGHICWFNAQEIFFIKIYGEKDWKALFKMHLK